MNQEPCRLCQTIYDGFDDIHKIDPLCMAGHLVRKEEGTVVFYVPCKDSFYDAEFTVNYCLNCGRKL